MDVKELQQLVLTRLRANLTDVRTSNIRTDTRKWILSRFPDSDESKNLDEFKNKFGYPLLIVQTPSLKKATMYGHGGMDSKYSLKIYIQHVGSVAMHDTLIKNIFADFKLANESNYYLENNLYLDEVDFSPDEENYTSTNKEFNSEITVTFTEDGE